MVEENQLRPYGSSFPRYHTADYSIGYPTDLLYSLAARWPTSAIANANRNLSKFSFSSLVYSFTSIFVLFSDSNMSNHLVSSNCSLGEEGGGNKCDSAFIQMLIVICWSN